MSLRDLFALRPGLVFLNHGSFGATPRAVLDAQSRWRERMEADPVDFFVRQLDGHLAHSRAALAAELAADPDDLALVPNVTAAVNAVVRSLRLQPGDELLTTDHAYNACVNVLRHVCERSGARLVVAEIPLPIADADEVTAALMAAANARTRLALVDHVTSPTGLVWPIADLVAALQGRGIDVLVDGAHAPGMLPLDLARLGAAYYTGNCHKWMFAPKGAGFLHVRRDRQSGLHPSTISHGYNAPLQPGRSRFRLEFDWPGTIDPTAFLAIPDGIAFGASVAGTWTGLREHNRALALHGRDLLRSRLGDPPLLAPDDMIGSLAIVALPDSDGAPATTPLYSDALQERLFREQRIEVPVVPWPRFPKRLLRISAQIYNTPSDYEELAAAIGS